MDQYLMSSIEQPRLSAALLMGFAAVAAAGLLLTAFAASWLPARRASAVQPIVALRGD